MKPFDLKAALAGSPVVTVSGEPVTGLHRFEGVTTAAQVLYGVKEGEILSWEDDGCFRYSKTPSGLDLRMAEG